MSLVDRLKKFLFLHHDQSRPLLLGYSGGPDSKALLYALLEAGVSALHVAHIDHGWREESQEEAKQLEIEVKQLGCFFHTTRLSFPSSGNPEAVARQKRFEFFHTLREQIPFQALLLAHHKKDLAETVIKRVFEGAHLSHLSGMQPVSLFHEFMIWRPFLKESRLEIEKFLEQNRLISILDPSNQDPTYLRARMRMTLLPFLEQTFGKTIEDNLAYLSQRSFELKAYLDLKVAHVTPHTGPWGTYISCLGLEKLEIGHLLQKHAPPLSKQHLERVVEALYTKEANLTVLSDFCVDRGFFFLLKTAPRFDGSLLLTVGAHMRGDWDIEISLTRESLPLPSWQSVWGGSFSVALPNGLLDFSPIEPSLRKLWNQAKVPAFLRNEMPLFVSQTGEYQDFLSGKKGQIDLNQPSFKVDFFYRGDRKKDN